MEESGCQFPLLFEAVRQGAFALWALVVAAGVRELRLIRLNGNVKKDDKDT